MDSPPHLVCHRNAPTLCVDIPSASHRTVATQIKTFPVDYVAVIFYWRPTIAEMPSRNFSSSLFFLFQGHSSSSLPLAFCYLCHACSVWFNNFVLNVALFQHTFGLSHISLAVTGGGSGGSVGECGRLGQPSWLCGCTIM